MMKKEKFRFYFVLSIKVIRNILLKPCMMIMPKMPLCFIGNRRIVPGQTPTQDDCIPNRKIMAGNFCFSCVIPKQISMGLRILIIVWALQILSILRESVLCLSIGSCRSPSQLCCYQKPWLSDFTAMASYTVAGTQSLPSLYTYFRFPHYAILHIIEVCARNVFF